MEWSEFKSLPGQNIKEEKSSLLQSMFHIGQQPFDQVSLQMNKKTVFFLVNLNFKNIINFFRNFILLTAIVLLFQLLCGCVYI